MAATKALGFVLPTGLFIQPSLNRRGGVRVSVFQCSVSSLTSTGLLEKPWSSYNARLVLEDGSVWSAKSFGASGTRVAELVFNTSLTGYQEILTSPRLVCHLLEKMNPACHFVI
ncbi:carbamoyl-phosphate synthase small chain, chloroplastic-like [Arabidopsis lyrata subsp. lyrata]|uniref:carbamoyl-phosphate synthase small chain, chloroplastic-like n=1 Tax=Arabidopsis lyrata subsp. lyrata TaxID=81972 RepID=UPI000A29D07F|nr:carbamoyl-phosphate synthase small chain, chloroplastic-like [Arabidopsis lyrata subsp. lyrata]|eukprot:XP_020885903.1 carbamoyl-phosphate synthase small chain, chloroplastic-like [Arabidopsis lyrata subsp. lyrata]